MNVVQLNILIKKAFVTHLNFMADFTVFEVHPVRAPAVKGCAILNQSADYIDDGSGTCHKLHHQAGP